MNRSEVSIIALGLIVVYGMAEVVVGLYGWEVTMGMMSLWLVLVVGKPSRLWRSGSDSDDRDT